MEVAWVHNWEVLLACILLLILIITFLLFVWRIVLCCNENRKRRKAMQNYLNLEDHMPSVKIVIPSRDPHYRVLEEYNNKESLALPASDDGKVTYSELFESSDSVIERPSFQTKSFNMQQKI